MRTTTSQNVKISCRIERRTQAEMLAVQQDTHVCLSCRHAPICAVAQKLAKRDGWYLALAQCAHFEPEPEHHRIAPEDVIK